MRRALAAVALAAAAPTAFAQAVELYGLIDVAVEHVNNVAGPAV